MAISAYPRTAVQNSKSNTNKPNGLSLMIVDPVTGEYTPATAATFAGGGGGGGGATATNQLTQISEAIITNSRLLHPVSNETITQLLFNDVAGKSIAQLLWNNDIGVSAADLLERLLAQTVNTNGYLTQIIGILGTISSNLTNGKQRVVIQDTSGNTANVTGENALLTQQV